MDKAVNWQKYYKFRYNGGRLVNKQVGKQAGWWAGRLIGRQVSGRGSSKLFNWVK